MGCARCCHLVVELQAGDDRVPEEWVVEYEGVRFMDQRGDGACVALDPVSRRCTLYEDRPAVCRQFDRGSALCRSVLLGPAAVRLLEASGVSSNCA
jgi:Fe-S-cluster containining protein